MNTEQAEQPPLATVLAATTVDMLVERMKTHPQEFFNETSLVSGDAEKIFAGTKWRRITTALLGTAPTSTNMIQAWFKPDEITRFRDGLLTVMREAFDAQMVEALVSGRPTFEKRVEPPMTVGTAYGQGGGISTSDYYTAMAQAKYDQQQQLAAQAKGEHESRYDNTSKQWVIRFAARAKRWWNES